MISKAIAIIFLTIGIASTALACKFDTDCRPGSRCAKADHYSIYGICTGGMAPGNSNDRVPVRNTFDQNDKIGQTCKFDIDCGFNRKCRKETYNIYGVCY